MFIECITQMYHVSQQYTCVDCKVVSGGVGGVELGSLCLAPLSTISWRSILLVEETGGHLSDFLFEYYVRTSVKLT
jgi:hypothetical protein